MPTAANEYIKGTDVIVQATFRNKAGDLADPDTVAAWSIAPDGTESALTPANVSTGIFEATVSAVDQSGVWEYKFKGSGSFNVAGIGHFSVQQDRFSN